MTKQATVTKSKPAAKAAPAKGKEAPAVKTAPAKTAPAKTEKPAKAAAPVGPALKTRIAPKGATLHVATDTARPDVGKLLAAHTHAALTVLGMLQPARPSANRAAVSTVMGARAVKYHVGKGNFEVTESGIRLTSAGYSSMTARVADGKVDVASANAFMDMLIDGKVEGTTLPKDAVYPVRF